MRILNTKRLVSRINLSSLKKIINRRVLVLGSLILFSLSMFGSYQGTFDEISVQRISFSVNPRYTYETNIFFNRTPLNYVDVYDVAGYLFTPPPYYAFLYMNETGHFQGYPTIVWCHGSLANAELQYHYAKELAAAGFKVLAINEPGHGDSGGKYSKAIDNLPMIYSAVDYLYYFCWDVDRNRIGVSGHSHGGVLTTRAGIFDNWINPRTNNTIGTGGKIKSFGAIYCWDDLLNTTTYMGLRNRPLNVLYPQLLYLDPDFLWIFSRTDYMSSTFPFTMPCELEMSSTSNYINSSNIGNYFLVVGSEDEFVSIPQECWLMEAATKNGGVPEVSAEEIFSNITSRFLWNFGNVSENTARRLMVVPGVSHLEEANDPIILQSLVSWFHESFNTGYAGQIPIRFDWNRNMLLRQAWIIGLLAALAAVPGLISYLAGWFAPKLKNLSISKKNPSYMRPMNLERNQKTGLIFIYCLFLIVSSGVGAYLVRNVFDIKTFIQFWNWNMTSIPILIISIIQIPFLMVVVWLERKHYNIKYDDSDSSIKKVLISICIGVLPVLLMVGIYDVLAYICNVPMLLPRPFEMSVYIDFFILFGIMLLFSLVNELTFRKLIQTKIEKIDGKLTRWKTVMKVSILNILILLIVFSTIARITFGNGFFVYFSPLEASAPFLALLCGCSCILSLINSYIYQRTRSIASTTFFSALLLTLLQAGKLFGSYI